MDRVSTRNLSPNCPSGDPDHVWTGFQLEKWFQIVRALIRFTLVTRKTLSSGSHSHLVPYLVSNCPDGGLDHVWINFIVYPSFQSVQAVLWFICGPGFIQKFVFESERFSRACAVIQITPRPGSTKTWVRKRFGGNLNHACNRLN